MNLEQILDSDPEDMPFLLAGICGCGDPEAVLALVVDLLTLDDMGLVTQQRIEERVAAQPLLAAQLLAHWMSELELTEHGSSIGYAWLAERGKKLIERYAKQEEARP